ncbi:SUN domain-containing protein 3-like isoform X3 [Erythrolamprus reginae]|uniref:SUN domain-containing protein 3-like isoform X3 n=1 Tax=Erythrolamprus reginae TaxID=121349 RepID=UPI00396C8E69
MDRNKKPRDSNEASSLRQGQKVSCSCKDSHPLFSHNRNNAQFPCPAKRSMLRLIYNLIVLSLITPFCLVKKLFTFISSRSYTQKIVIWITLFLLLFGATYLGLLDGNWLSGDERKDYSICDFTQSGTKDLRSLKKANYILKSKALQIQFLKEQKQKLQIELQEQKLTMNYIAYNTVDQILEQYISKGITRWNIEKILKKLEQRLDEDVVQMTDFALQSTGASIVQSRTTRSYHYLGWTYSWKSFIIFPFVKSPDIILQGLKAEEEKQGTFLGQFTYDVEGFLIQTFQLKNESPELIKYIKLKVISSWGHPKYTCIYRLRVHGNPSAT